MTITEGICLQIVRSLLQWSVLEFSKVHAECCGDTQRLAGQRVVLNELDQRLRDILRAAGRWSQHYRDAIFLSFSGIPDFQEKLKFNIKFIDLFSNCLQIHFFN